MRVNLQHTFKLYSSPQPFIFINHAWQPFYKPKIYVSEIHGKILLFTNKFQVFVHFCQLFQPFHSYFHVFFKNILLLSINFFNLVISVISFIII